MENEIQKNVTKNRDLWIELIRIIAIFAVVAIHVDTFVFSWNKISWIEWWVSNVYNALIRFAVPILFILSGYLLLDKQEDDRIFFSKRFNKVVIPLVAWSMIYMIFVSKYNILSIFTVDFVQKFLADKIFYHLYFLYYIIGLYLITPLLRRILAHANMYDIRYYLGLWFFFTPVNQLIGFFGYNIGIPVEAATGNLGLYIIGYAIKKTQTTEKIIYLSGVIVATSLIVMIFGTYIMSMDSGKFNTFLTSTNITQTTYAICLFILLREALNNTALTMLFLKIENIISTVAKASMGIYLVHPILLHYIRHGLFGVFLLSPSFMSPIISVPLVTVLLFVVSLIIVIIMQKIPLIRKIVP
ncbi:acyltransferase [Methanosarcina sp.]|jgi:surface polysaccharide O-acyltransferase-like enzyme|uniref:acyltransferase n=1 Tax=Methanosarcina sp. TaxID=2213 RepID=UPI003BB5176A